jgi:glycosyltransferase involved in cell wall biosynthesis
VTRVSVVVPSFNNASFIAGTISSILNQTMRDFELIVADHSSSDGTPNIIKEFLSDRRVTLTRTEAGGGAQRNWNRVSQLASGEFVKLVCGDDLLHEDALEVQLAALEAHPGVALVSSQRRIVDARGRQVIGRRGLAGLNGVERGPRAVRRSVVVGSNIFGEPACVLMRRDQLAQAGWWTSQFPYLIDQATYSRMLGKGDFLALPKVVADFRLSDSQWSVDLASKQFHQVRAFHAWAQEAYPEVISKADVFLGNARAGALAASRRALYAMLAARMRPIQAETYRR